MPLFLGSDINETLKITTSPSQVQNYHHIPEWHHHAYISEMRSQQPKINFVCGCVCMICQYFSASISLIFTASYRNTLILHFVRKHIFHCSMSSFHVDFKRLPLDTRTPHPDTCLSQSMLITFFHKIKAQLSLRYTSKATGFSFDLQASLWH